MLSFRAINRLVWKYIDQTAFMIFSSFWKQIEVGEVLPNNHTSCNYNYASINGWAEAYSVVFSEGSSETHTQYLTINTHIFTYAKQGKTFQPESIREAPEMFLEPADKDFRSADALSWKEKKSHFRW